MFNAQRSCCRCCRIYNIQTKNCVHTVSKLTLPDAASPKGGDAKEKDKPRSFRMFHDDTMRSFFRRLAFRYTCVRVYTCVCVCDNDKPPPR